jgi:hypothetical protein
VVKRPSIGTEEDMNRVPCGSLNLEAAVLLRYRKAVEHLLNRPHIPGLATSGVVASSCNLRHLGAAAALLGRHDEARSHDDDATKIWREMPFRPELALGGLELAELLLDHVKAGWNLDPFLPVET